ncbi:hypothetical protein ACH4T9_13600 [Micromonospora sp. NPDC020750]|uniref:hypothetical protein n=1 Tax=unclassified Micromonospora TaxID=2617518 RepID=UPI0037A1B905
MGIVNVVAPAGLQTLSCVRFAHQGPYGIALLDLQDQSTGSRQLLTLGLPAFTRSGDATARSTATGDRKDEGGKEHQRAFRCISQNAFI